MIKRLSRISDCGVFRDFVWPRELPEFKQYNLIYGWNGTGKTTLARILRSLELREPPKIGNIELDIDGIPLRSTNFPGATTQIRVYDRDFVAENVFSSGGVAPILVLGKDSAEKQKMVQSSVTLRERADRDAILFHDEAERAERELDRFCRDRARHIKDVLHSAGENRFNNYNKSDFRAEADTIGTVDGARVYLLNEGERQLLLSRIGETAQEPIPMGGLSLPSTAALLESVNGLLETAVVAEAIESLSNDDVVQTWVREGLSLHGDRKLKTCLFCGQPLPPRRVIELERHFSRAYGSLVSRLEEQAKALSDLVDRLNAVQLPDSGLLYKEFVPAYEDASVSFNQARKDIIGFMERLLEALQGKMRRPLEQLAPIVSKPKEREGICEKVLSVIAGHNQACVDFHARVGSARRRLEKGLVAESMDEYLRLLKLSSNAAAAERTARADAAGLQLKIAELQRDIIHHRRPAEELNEDLRRYLGHNELQLSVKETGYEITRNSVLADSLSEGETTAIALLYFLRCLGDHRFDMANGVVVLDDPVSSLDSNALYLACGLIRERTKGAGQLFVLTHNFTLFSEVRHWFRGLNRNQRRDPARQPARFYMINCTIHERHRESRICRLDPLLEDHNSDYHYLFSQIHKVATSGEAGGLEPCYALPNMARRLLETFLSFRYPDVTDLQKLSKLMEHADFDPAKKQAILRFTNAFSHADAIGEQEHDISVLAESTSVAKDIIELMERNDKQHFDALVRSLGAPEPEN